MHGAEASNPYAGGYYVEGGLISVRPNKLNLRRRFWRWVLGENEPLYTENQVKDAVRSATSPRPLISIDAGAAFSIIDAVNGKIIRYSDCEGDDRLLKTRSGNVSDGPKYYVVPEGQKLLDAIAVVLAKARLTER